MSAAPLLKVEGLRVAYGHIEAVKGIDFELHEGRITTLVGANGAGKSTTLLALSGLVAKAAGRVVLDGQDLTALSPHRIVASGMVQVAEGRATLTTNPAPTGSVTFVNTIGKLRVARCNCAKAAGPLTRMTSGASATNSAAYLR